MKRSWKIIFGIIAGLAVVVIIICMSPIGRFIITGGLGELEEQPFDIQQWKAVENSDPVAMRVRLMMLDDLMENKLKTGMDSLTVKEMLGEPERTYGFSYNLGAIAKGMDPVYLALDFDAAGKLSKINTESKSKMRIKVQ